MPLPHITDIDQMKDSDLLYAADLKGKTVTVTILDANERNIVEEDEDRQKKSKKLYLLDLKGTAKKLGVNATNRTLIGVMFGRNPNTWNGKRITIKPATTRMAGETVPCIRVCGSPDIAGDINVKTRLGRSTLKTVLTRTVAAKAPSAQADTQMRPQADQSVTAAWMALGWTAEEGQKHLEERGDIKLPDYLAHLNNLIDEQNAREAGQ